MSNDTSAICVICYEPIESHHTNVTQTDCPHTFHVICINVWLARHTTCPICRRSIRNNEAPLNLHTVSTMAIVVTHEILLERATYTYAFLLVLLEMYKTGQTWFENRDTIISMMERFEIGTIRLPFLDLTSRTTAKREKHHWKTLYEQFDQGNSVRYSQRIVCAKQHVFTFLHERLHIFEKVHTIEYPQE